MEFNLGVTGAKRQSFSDNSARAMLVRIIERYPNETMEKWIDIALEELTDHPELLRGVVSYWLASEYRNLKNPPRKQQPPRAAAEQQVASVRVGFVKEIDRRVQIVLSNMLLPSGTRLIEADKAECESVGGWLSNVAACLSDGQRVGEVFNEESLKKIYIERLP